MSSVADFPMVLPEGKPSLSLLTIKLIPRMQATRRSDGPHRFAEKANCWGGCSHPSRTYMFDPITVQQINI